jgi:RNA polymerase sigma factor (sigma-70 family)
MAAVAAVPAIVGRSSYSSPRHRTPRNSIRGDPQTLIDKRRGARTLLPPHAISPLRNPPTQAAPGILTWVGRMPRHAAGRLPATPPGVVAGPLCPAVAAVGIEEFLTGFPRGLHGVAGGGPVWPAPFTGTPPTGRANGGLTSTSAQAAADAMLAIIAKLGSFRGESRFTTWAYRFAVLEVSAKLGRHYWLRHPAGSLDAEDWDRLPDRLGTDPGEHAAHGEMITAIRRAVDHELTARQRRLFIAVVLNGIPLDAVVIQTGMTRNAIYKAIFDARRKIPGHS